MRISVRFTAVFTASAWNRRRHTTRFTKRETASFHNGTRSAPCAHVRKHTSSQRNTLR